MKQNNTRKLRNYELNSKNFKLQRFMRPITAVKCYYNFFNEININIFYILRWNYNLNCTYFSSFCYKILNMLFQNMNARYNLEFGLEMSYKTYFNFL